MKVILIVEVVGLKDKETFEKHLKKEGFNPVEGEEFAYEGDTTTHLNNTRTYVLEVVSKGLKKSGGFEECKIIFQVGQNPMEAYKFNQKEGSFSGVEL